MTHVVYLNFFGVPVKVSVDTPTDDRYLRFFFHRFVAECTSVELHVTLRSENPEGFFSSLLAKGCSLKTIRVVEEASDETVTFRDWSGVPSPLPPFGREAYANRLCVVPGAALVTPTGDCVLLVGGTHAGKTALELDLLSTGWRTMADHLVVFDLQSGCVLPYLTPVGIRGKGLLRWSDALRRAEVLETSSELSGRVVLVDVESLVPGSSWDTPLQPRKIFVLMNEGAHIDGFTVRVFPQRHRDALMQLLPDHMIPIENVASIRAVLENVRTLSCKEGECQH